MVAGEKSLKRPLVRIHCISLVRLNYEQDGKGRKIQTLGNLSRSNIGNYDLMLTLDEVIQFTTEHLLKKQVEKFTDKKITNLPFWINSDIWFEIKVKMQ